MVRLMRDKEILRGQLMVQLVENKLSQQKAAERLELSVRQVKHLKRLFLQYGTNVNSDLKLIQFSHKQRFKIDTPHTRDCQFF